MQESTAEWQLGSNGEGTAMISKQELALLLCKKAGVTRKNNKRATLTKEEMYKINVFIDTKCKLK